MPVYKSDEVWEYLEDVYREVGRQQSIWGVQVHPDGTGNSEWVDIARDIKAKVDQQEKDGETTWLGIFLEEVVELAEAATRGEILEEMNQCAAVLVSWKRNILDR